MSTHAQPDSWVVALAREMLVACRSDQQATRRIESDEDAAVLRRTLTRLARPGDMRIRTARIGSSVAVVRTDAAIWNDDAATMRAKLQPPADPLPDGALGDVGL